MGDYIGIFAIWFNGIGFGFVICVGLKWYFEGRKNDYNNSLISLRMQSILSVPGNATKLLSAVNNKKSIVVKDKNGNEYKFEAGNK